MYVCVYVAPLNPESFSEHPILEHLQAVSSLHVETNIHTRTKHKTCSSGLRDCCAVWAGASSLPSMSKDRSSYLHLRRHASPLTRLRGQQVLHNDLSPAHPGRSNALQQAIPAKSHAYRTLCNVFASCR